MNKTSYLCYYSNCESLGSFTNWSSFLSDLVTLCLSSLLSVKDMCLWILQTNAIKLFVCLTIFKKTNPKPSHPFISNTSLLPHLYHSSPVTAYRIFLYCDQSICLPTWVLTTRARSHTVDRYHFIDLRVISNDSTDVW